MTTNTTIRFPLEDGEGNTFADLEHYAYAFARRSLVEPNLDLAAVEAYDAAVEAYDAAVEALAGTLVAAAAGHDGDFHDLWWELA